MKWFLAIDAVAAAAAGIAIAVFVYIRKRVPAERVEPDLLLHAYHYEETLAVVVGDGGEQAAEALASVDAGVVDGAVNGAGRLALSVGNALRPLQTGFVRSYALAIAGGGAVALGWFLVRAGF
jgi:NADH-quinone oxidoreductase subunit L